jgi:probable rRNA maturation factor
MRKHKLLNINKRGLEADFSWLFDLEKIIKRDYKLKKQISIALIDESEIQKLNKVYRKKNKVTDVLSFILDSDQVLGEVLICLSQARRQAKERNDTYKAELQLLTVHGILHLLGYDHEINNKEAKKQELAEQKILGKLNK